FLEKDVAVFTPISLEHTKILGATPREIAVSKSGIITRGCVAVLAPQKDSGVKDVIADRCKAVGAELVDVATRYKIAEVDGDDQGQNFVLNSPSASMPLAISMLGYHQIENAATAVAAFDALGSRGVRICKSAVQAGLAAVKVPGRFEVLRRAPLVVADGAHNQESMQALTKAIKDSLSFRRCIFVVGVHQDKDLKGILATLRPLMDRLVCTRSRSLRAMPPDSILSLAGALGCNGYSTNSVSEAMEFALAIARPEDLVCVTGSLAVVAEVRELLTLSAAART